MLKLVQHCCIKMMGLLQRCKLSLSGRRTKVFNLILCPVLKEESRGSGKLIQPIYAAANAICSFTGETKEMQPEQPPENFVTLATLVSQDSSVKALSPIRDTKRGNSSTSSQLEEVLPVNRSSLSPFKSQSLILMQPCSARKRKLLNIENAVMQQIEVSYDQSFGAKKFETTGPLGINLVNLENLQILMASAHKILNLVHEYCIKFEELLKRSKLSFSGRRMKVKEKLSAEEYRKFVEFMKALKSKEMKISQVLQSIVRLFSGPQRLHLLESISALTLAIIIVNRFKDYLPAKYHSLYEQHLVTNNDKL
ncbi:regulator of telomere elongation helicase 1 like protein [Quercus suber]|uniref:Regulator of telomere elongation helicase 1 like protein n=1 Tax=Quercus suber TaxID=58331 RepID=A0AAW0KFK9_QUESU